VAWRRATGLRQSSQAAISSAKRQKRCLAGLVGLDGADLNEEAMNRRVAPGVDARLRDRGGQQRPRALLPRGLRSSMRK
jgi:hypothetical protein